MRLLSSYIMRSVLGAIALTLLVIVMIDVIGAINDGTGDIAKDYTFQELLIYVTLTLPARIYEYIPISSLIGCLIGLGVLANNSELVVMRAAGISVLKIVWLVLRPALILVFIGALLGEYVVPYSGQYAESRRMLLKGGKTAQESVSGFWNKEGSEFMHFNAVYPGGILFGVTRYQFNDQHVLEQSSFSRRASFQGDHWVEELGAITHFYGDRTEVSTFITRDWTTNLSPQLLNFIALPPESLAIKGLYDYSRYLKQQGQDASKYELVYWKKVLKPITIISLVFIAISFVFGPLRQVTMGYRIFAGVVVGLIFRTSQDLLGPASIVFGFSPLLAVALPVGICCLIGIVLLHRAS